MIRLRSFNYRSTRMSSGMRTTTKIQITAAILCGFLLGYVLIPSSIFSSRTGDQEEDEPVERVTSTVPLKRIREKAIEFSVLGESFVVEGRNMRILSGAIHYFRVVPGYWEDRLMRLKAAGLNTVETYVAWNMHEPIPGHYDFTGILDLGEFIRTAQKEGLHVIVRPGPYICAEWDMGGLPAWLLHDPNMKLRSTYPPYLQAVKRYFTRLFEILVPLQSAYGGPIIAFQVENEFSQYTGTSRADGREYLRFLYQLMHNLGVIEMLFTSDGQFALDDARALRPARDVLITVNFQKENGGLKQLQNVQPHKPLMVMEFWTGWFDHWNEPHLTRNILPDELAITLKAILDRGASINFYMFHGGTNFGFMNGGNWGDGDSHNYQPTITSYDYDAPVSEYGDITEKYKKLRNVLLLVVPESLSVYPLPPLPPNLPKEAYGDVKLTLYISLLGTLQYVPDPHVSEHPVAMEYLSVNGQWGQGYGYVLYRTLIPADSTKITVQGVKDYGLAMVDYKPVKKLSYFEKETFLLQKTTRQESVLDKHGSPQVVLDILVENAGRVNYGVPLESRKGILGGVEVDGKEQKQWKIYSFEFKSAFVENIDSGGMWQRTPAPSQVGPTLFKGTLNINGQPKDTFLDMEGWGKGIVFINSANLGRYWSVGPQRTLYVPAPILQRGVNKVMIFEMEQPRNPQVLTFRDSPILSTNSHGL